MKDIWTTSLFVNGFAALAVVLLSCGCEHEEAQPPAEPPLVAKARIGDRMPAADSAEQRNAADEMARFVPDWVSDAIFYQIFPERFRNGDSSNDPTRESLEAGEVPQNWRISPWSGDWYAQDDWEKAMGGAFYEAAVFHRRYGGDLQGVLDKLDYLEELGINTVYFNPVFYARSLHKYDGASMHHIDPYFGPDPEGDFEIIAKETADPATWQWTAADKLFLQLIRELHARDIRVIIDGVFNHTGRDFFAFADIVKNQEKSPYKDWYIVQHFDNPDTEHWEFRYKSWWGFESLPEFADNDARDDLHPGPKEYLMNITRRWMDPDGNGDPGDGIDGWRLDVANEVPSGFWKDWNTLVRELNPEAYTVGEFWGDARKSLMDGRFSATMNYHGFAYPVKGYLIDGKLTPHDFGMQLGQRMDEYPRSMRYAMQNLIDSHDTDRVASMIVNAGQGNYRQPERFDYDVSEVVSPRNSNEYQLSAPDEKHRQLQRLVALMQMTFVGPPMVYYGTESGMWGADDPCNRQPMVWDDLTYDQQTQDPRGAERPADEVRFQQELFDYYKSVIQLRKDHSPLRQGSFEVVSFDDEAKTFAFRRKSDEGDFIVAINRGDQSYAFDLPCPPRQSMRVVFRAGGDADTVSVEQQSQQATVAVPALDAVVIEQVGAAEK